MLRKRNPTKNHHCLPKIEESHTLSYFSPRLLSPTLVLEIKQGDKMLLCSGDEILTRRIKVVLLEIKQFRDVLRKIKMSEMCFLTVENPLKS